MKAWIKVSAADEERDGRRRNFFDVTFKGEVAVKYDSEVVDVWGDRQSGVVDGEAEIVLVRDFGPMTIMLD